MDMKLLINLLCTFTIVASAKKYPLRQCPYRSTVDLTNQTFYRNGSYLYQGVLIPYEEQAMTHVNFRFGYEKVNVPAHLRGCVCNKPKSCIKLCCEKYEIFNVETLQCETLAKNLKVSWDLDIKLTNNLSKVANVFQEFIYQVGIPCEMPKYLQMDFKQWSLLENGTISEENEYLPLDTVNYCLTPQWSAESEEYLLMPFSCGQHIYVEPWRQTLNSYAMAISVLFLIATIVVYLSIKELRSNLRGQILICYLISLVMAYGIICSINIPRIMFEPLPCKLLGYSCYYFFMAAFLWLSVLSYDIWINFKHNTIAVQARDNRKVFALYSLHAWGWPTIFTAITLWADLSPSVEEFYKPSIGPDMCFINTYKWSAAIYFYGPNLIILIISSVIFAYLTVHIYRVQRDTAKIMNADQCLHENSYIAILRLFLLMGVSWIFDILSYFLPQNEWQLLFALSDFLNALQGPLIFVLFVLLKRNVLNLLKTRFMPRKSTISGSTTNTFDIQSSTSCETSM